MSTDSTKGSNGAPTETANGVGAETVNHSTEADGVTASSKDTVAYETYKKTLALAKKREAELTAEREEKQKLLEEKLTAEGKKDELIESWKKKYTDLESKTKKLVGSFSYNALSSVVSEVAAKEGCVDPGDLMALGDLSSIEVDDEFKVNKDQVKEFVLSMKKAKPHLFSGAKAQPKVGAAPQTGDVSGSDAWKKLSPVDQAKLAMKGLLKQ